MRLDRNICTKCKEKNFSDDEYNTELALCNECFEKAHTVALYSPIMLKKDMFETTQEHKERVNNLGWLEVGKVTLNSYDADTEMFFITLSLNHPIIFKTLDTKIKIQRKEAKQLYETSKKYKLIAQIKVTNDTPSFKTLKFQEYEIEVNSIINIANLCWRDEKSGLSWEVKREENIEKTYTWDAALHYAKQLNAKNYAGFNDWRVPTIDELKTLIGKKTCKDVYNIKKELASNTRDYNYWSSSEYVSDTSRAWLVHFVNGYTFSYYKSYSNCVRCVRGRQ